MQGQRRAKGGLQTLLALCATLAPPAYAVEGGLGRSITGLQVTDYAGVVPPDPGLTMAMGYVYYSGSISADRELPISGVASLGLDADFAMYSLSGVYVWPTQGDHWNFASMITVPFADVDITANLDGGSIRRSVNDSFSGDLYDISIAPIMAGYHLDKTKHLSMALYVSAPVGDYNPERLANPSLNAWVLSPRVSYTQLLSQGSVDWSTSAGFDFSSKNDETDYRSGVVFHVDSQLVKHFSNGWGVGGVAAWIEQVSDDSGPLAERLDGFRGRAWALGPTVSYQRKHGEKTFALSARWLHEFGVRRRLAGNPLMITGSITL